jgi:hypothetical protein
MDTLISLKIYCKAQTILKISFILLELFGKPGFSLNQSKKEHVGGSPVYLVPGYHLRPVKDTKTFTPIPRKSRN